MEPVTIPLTDGKTLTATDIARSELVELANLNEPDRIPRLLSLIAHHLGLSSTPNQLTGLGDEEQLTLAVMWLRALGYEASGGTVESNCAALLATAEELGRVVANNPILGAAIEKGSPWVDRILGPNNQLLSRLKAPAKLPPMPAGARLFIPDPALDVGGGWPELPEHENLDVSVVFDRLAAVVRAAPAMWPSVELRVMGSLDNSRFRTYLVNGQGLFDEVPEMDEAIWVEPAHVRQIVLKASNFIELMSRWVDGEPFQIGEVAFLPPPAQWLSFGRAPIDVYQLRRILRALPPAQSHYKTIFGMGSGDQLQDIEQLIYSACRAAQLSQQEWTREYVGLEHHGQGAFISIQLPVGVRLDAAYSVTAHMAAVTVHYRRPFVAERFWLRVGERFAVTGEAFRLESEEPLANGWFRASADVSFSHTQGFVYLGTDARPGRVEWQLLKPIGRQISRTEGRLALLPGLYSLAGVSLAGDLQQATLAATGGAKASAAGRFETALANACVACGYEVLFGGKLLSTRQLDFLALDESAGRVHAVSVTTSNRVLDKFRDLKLAVARLAQDCGPAWSWRMVIISAQPRATCVEAEVVALEQDGGVFIGWDVVATLLGDVPDLALFKQSFELGHLPYPPVEY